MVYMKVYEQCRIERRGVTERELVDVEDMVGRHDLIEGDLWGVPYSTPQQGSITYLVLVLIGRYIEEHPEIGIAGAGSEVGCVFARNPDTVIGPDVVYMRRDRLDAAMRKHWIPCPPDFALEQTGPWDTEEYRERKLAVYLAAEVPLLWWIDPEAETIAVFSRGKYLHTLGTSDVIDGGDVIPGLSIECAEIFRD